MSRRSRFIAPALLGLAFAAQAWEAAAAEKPKVRAVTAFVKIDRTQYTAQIAQTLKMLRQAKRLFEEAGYPVESARITTQPFPEYIQGLSKQQVLDFFRAYDERSKNRSTRTSDRPCCATPMIRHR